MWILGLCTSHDSSVTLFKDEELVLHLSEERLSHRKHDSGPFYTLATIKKYTDVIDYCAFSYINNAKDNTITAFKKYLETICNVKVKNWIDLSAEHHSLHALTAFYNSGFDDAVAVVLDGAGSDKDYGKEVESIFSISKLDHMKCLYASVLGTSFVYGAPDYVDLNQKMGPGLVYASVSLGLGFCETDCGKVMGLSAYGKDDENIKQMISKRGGVSSTFRYDGFYDPAVNYRTSVGYSLWDYPYIKGCVKDYDMTVTGKDFPMNFDKDQDQKRKNLAYKVQKEFEEYILFFVKKALEISGKKNIVFSGGCALNCVNNYKLLNQLPEDVNLYVEPVCADDGISFGAAYAVFEYLNKNYD